MTELSLRSNMWPVATVAIMQLANSTGQAQKRWVSGIQTRVDVTASVLGSMKVRCLDLTA